MAKERTNQLISSEIGSEFEGHSSRNAGWSYGDGREWKGPSRHPNQIVASKNGLEFVITRKGIVTSALRKYHRERTNAALKLINSKTPLWLKQSSSHTQDTC